MNTRVTGVPAFDSVLGGRARSDVNPNEAMRRRSLGRFQCPIGPPGRGAGEESPDLTRRPVSLFFDSVRYHLLRVLTATKTVSRTPTNASRQRFFFLVRTLRERGRVPGRIVH